MEEKLVVQRGAFVAVVFEAGEFERGRGHDGLAVGAAELLAESFQRALLQKGCHRVGSKEFKNKMKHSAAVLLYTITRL